MATFRLWLFAILIIIEEIAMGWFGNKDNSSTSPTTGTVPTPAVTPAVDPGATPDPSTTVASATPVPDPVTPVTVPLPTTKVVDPVPANPTPTSEEGDEYSAAGRKAWRQWKEETVLLEKVLIPLEILIIITLMAIPGLVPSGGAVMCQTQVERGVSSLQLMLLGAILWYFALKYIVPDETGSKMMRGDRPVPAVIQLIIIGWIAILLVTSFVGG